MTTDFFDSRGNSAGNETSVEALRASTGLQLTVGDLSSRALAIITPALIDWAAKKNVPLGDQVAIAAQYTLERIDPVHVASLLAFDQSSVREMRRAIFVALDVACLFQIYHCAAAVEGRVPDPQRLLAIAEQRVTEFYALLPIRSTL